MAEKVKEVTIRIDRIEKIIDAIMKVEILFGKPFFVFIKRSVWIHFDKFRHCNTRQLQLPWE